MASLHRQELFCLVLFSRQILSSGCALLAWEAVRGCWSVLGSLVEQVEVNLKLTSLTIRFSPFTKNHGDSVAVLTPSLLSLDSFLSRERLCQHSPLSLSFLSSPHFAHETFFKINTEPVTQASIIVAVVAFSSCSLAFTAIYSQSPSVCVFCGIMLAVIVYSALCLAPC
jgi:hypothetical protein